MLDTNVNRPDFAWLNESSRIFLHRGYLLEGTEPEDRIRYIADHAEKLLDYPGFADKFYHYMARGYYSLASPIWSNFGLDRGLPISCVTGDTWINTKSGGKQAKDIVVGDMVLTHKNRYRPVTKVIPTKDKGDIYRLKVSLEIDELYITGNHPVLTQEGWVKVEDLDIQKHLVAVNNEILKNDKDHVIDENVFVANDGIEYYSILSFDKTDKVEDVYDFTVEEDHSFSCAGVIVHNCFGSYIGDSIYDIMSTTAEVGMMSKTGGGTSGYFGAIRPRGAPIKDNGHSDGSFNFAKLFDTVIDVISQGTSRKGQFAGYIDIEHPDIEEWLDIHKEGNPIQLMYYGVCIGDQWLKEMKEGDAEKRRIWAKVLQRKAESGIPYLFFKDNVNNQKPDVYKDKDMTIYASNLCVSGDTTILTKEYGHTPIAEHVGEYVTVWNGQEWSPNVQLVKTGENQQLYLVKLSNGREIKCTGYHKWFVKNRDDNEAVIKETLSLQEGDMLDRWSLPVMEGHLELEDAYTNGFFTGDGCRHKGTDIVYLYHEKKDLRPFITGDIRNEHYAPVEDRITLRMKGLRDKFFVPNHEYTIKSRLEWLAGYLDADGCIYRCDGSEQITASSINKDFLDDLHDMLSTLGVDSKIRVLREGGQTWLPLNNGFDEYGLFQTKRVYRLLISGYESQKLLNLGLKLNRLKITQRPYNRFLNKRVMVEGVFELPDREDTYCCNEPLRHRVIFNGVNTGNCSEIALPSSLEESFVCCLSSMNALYFDEWKDTDAVETMTYFLDAVMEEFIQKSKSIPMMEKANRFASRHRAIGIGVLGWHSYLQHKHIAFESFQAMQLNNELFKTIQERSYAASREMAERYGEPEILKGYGRRNTTHTCVRSDTKVLTDRGNIPIIELIGKKTTIWNGYEWSEVTPFETGKKKLYRVTFSDGKYLDCTSDHIFKVVSVKIDRTEEMNGRRVLDVPLDKLRVGDVISKYKLPIIDGDMEFEDAYTQGFFTGDGSILHADRKNPEKEIRLYGSKMVCKDRIKWIKVRDCNYNGRELIRGKISSDYCDKYTVPNGYCTLKSKLDWLAGILDSDGSSTSCGMEISTAREDFAQNIVEMLSTLGCQSRMSRITRKPNQGYPGSSPYYWIVTISFQSCTILYDLGLRTERVKIPVGPCGYSSAPQYGWRTVKSIVDLGIEEMTYCFTEPKRNTGVFNGVMTGQCVAPTKSSSFILGGVSPSVEPIRSNYYIKDLAKIKTTYRNPLLTKVLQEKGLDNEATWQSILVNDGSVQHLEGLSDEDKAVFKTWQEISQLTIIQQAAQRQKYIDQGQSINILVHPDTPTKDINQLYLTAHELGMKSIYYQFSMSAAQKFNRALLNTCTTCES